MAVRYLPDVLFKKKGMSAHQLWRNLWGVNELTGKPNGSYQISLVHGSSHPLGPGQEPIAAALNQGGASSKSMTCGLAESNVFGLACSG